MKQQGRGKRFLLIMGTITGISINKKMKKEFAFKYSIEEIHNCKSFVQHLKGKLYQ